MPRQAKKTQPSKVDSKPPPPPVKVEELPPIQPPTLLGDIELSEQSSMCEMMENMAQQRKKILESEDEEKWNKEKCDDLFRFLRKEIFDKILIENIFISLDIEDLMQAFCDFRKKYLKHFYEDKKALGITTLYIVKMKYLAIQIIDEIVKELFHMEDEEFEDDEDEDEENDNEELFSKNARKNPGKFMYKSFN